MDLEKIPPEQSGLPLSERKEEAAEGASLAERVAVYLGELRRCDDCALRSGAKRLVPGEGTLGKLVKNNDVYAETLSSLQDVRKMVNSVKQNSDAIKTMPIIRSYVVRTDLHHQRH